MAARRVRRYDAVRRTIAVFRHPRCSLIGHYPDLVLPYRSNAGLDFATCHHCRREIVKPLRARWDLVPPGMRVVWRPPVP